MFMHGTRMFYKLAIEDFTILFWEASEQGNKTKVNFRTGSTGFVSYLYHVYLSIIKELNIKVNPVQQICVYLRLSAV